MLDENSAKLEALLQSAEAPDSTTEWFLKLTGIRGWINWAVEPAERAGCPPGKLLPDPPELPPGVSHRVLVLGLEDCLIHTEWDRVHGHRTKKRPGLDAFLAHASQYYEIVIFSSALQSYADPIVRPFFESGYVHHMLCRENTKYVNGKYVKDLSYLNRDLRHVVIVDTNPDSYSHQPFNAVPIKPWRDDTDDTELVDLVPFIEAIVKEDVPDVRDVIRHFQGTYFPDKFRSLKYQAIERKKKGAALLGRARVPPGVLPVLSTLTPHRLAPHLAPPAPTKPAAHTESKAADSEDGHSVQPHPAAQQAPKNVFQRAKEMKM